MSDLLYSRATAEKNMVPNYLGDDQRPDPTDDTLQCQLGLKPQTFLPQAGINIPFRHRRQLTLQVAQ
jgi:hypothetical protein